MSAFVIKKVNTGIMFNSRPTTVRSSPLPRSTPPPLPARTASTACAGTPPSPRWKTRPPKASPPKSARNLKCTSTGPASSASASRPPTARSSPPAKATRPRKVAKTASLPCAKTLPWRKLSRNKPPQPRLAHAASTLFPRRRLFFPTENDAPSSALEEGRFAAGRRRR